MSSNSIQPILITGLNPLREIDLPSLEKPSTLKTVRGRNIIKVQRTGDTSCEDMERGVVARIVARMHMTTHHRIKFERSVFLPRRAIGGNGGKAEREKANK